MKQLLDNTQEGGHRYLGRTLILIITGAAILIGGSTESWQRGGIAVLMGAAWLLAPPKYSLGKTVGFLTLALFLVASTSFLPISWFGLPGWRLSLEEDLGLPLPPTLSPQPWISLDALSQLAVGLLWLLYVLGQRWKDEERILSIQILALVIATTAVTALVCNISGYAISFWGSHTNLGPFPNRNHFATLLAVGAVLAATCAYDRSQQKDYKGSALYITCLMVCFVTAIANSSRAGVVLIFIGIGVWVGIVSLATKTLGRLAISASLLIIAAAMFLLFGGGLLARFSFDGDFAQTLSDDGRIPIYKDCILLASQNPLFGIGLGNFEGVFSLSQQRYQNLDRVIHPESDWLWLTTELGLFGLAIVLWLLISLLFRVGNIWPNKRSKRGRRRQHRLRMGAAVAACLVAVHGTFDVPGHIFGLVLPAILLLSLAASNRSQLAPAKWPGTLLKVSALPIIALGANMVLTHYWHLGTPSNEGAKQLYAQSVALSMQADKAQEAYDAATRATKIKPLHWEYHFQQGLLSARVGKSPQTARKSFQRARFLEQQSTFVTAAEANFWLREHPPYVVNAWRETLVRDPGRLEENFGRILKQAKDDPQLRDAARSLANPYPKLKIALLRNLRGIEFKQELDNMLAGDPELSLLDDDERRQVFELWAKRGDYDALIAALEEHPSWNGGGWNILAERHAEKGEFNAAINLINTHYTPPDYKEIASRDTINQLAKEFYINPNDVTKGLRLFYAQARALELGDAIVTLDKLGRLRNAPPYLSYLRYKLYRDNNEYEKAWEAFRNQAVK